MIHRVVATVDLSALRDNVLAIKACQPEAKLLAVVKADAYGHGVSRLIDALRDVDGLAVARINEALELRNAGYLGTIVVLGGILSSDELDIARQYHLDLVIHNYHQVELFNASAKQYPARLWVKFDSGMNRLGFKHKAEFDAAMATLTSFISLDNIVLLTHFANADVEESAMTDYQVSMFQALVTSYPKLQTSLSNSAAILRYPQLENDWIRPGLALYGVAPWPTVEKILKPVMTLSSVVVELKDIAKGEAVGYGQTWHAQKATRIAIVAVGYGDGYPRSVADGTPVSINGKRYPIVGRVSMDMLTVDVGDADINIGTCVELWGNQLDVADIAMHAGTIAWELLLNLTSRVHFVYR